MRFGCTTCGKTYEIPDARVRAAGVAGLRVRCKKCRAIMAIDTRTAIDGRATRAVVESGDEIVVRAHAERSARSASILDIDRLPDTEHDLPTRRRAPSSSAPELTDIRGLDERPGPLPAVFGASGELVPLPGVERSLSGVKLARRAKRSRVEDDVWFAAIDGRARGPFTRAELAQLADEGRVRGRTLVWRPGMPAWTRVRSGEVDDASLQWLRDVVIQRKREELLVAGRAQRKMGIHAIVLDDDTARLTLPPPAPDERGVASASPLLDAVFADDLVIDAQTIVTERPLPFYIGVGALVIAGLVVAVALAGRLLVGA
jgi:hypothetical protein